MSEKLFDEMHNLYQVSKTLRFELQPQGRTKEYFEKNILEEDELKAEKFKVVKKYCDEYHKIFIDRCLKKLNSNDAFAGLLKEYEKEYIETLKTDTQSKNKSNKEDSPLNKVKEKLRTMISESFTEDDEYKGLFGKEIINSYLKVFYAEDKEVLSDIEIFNKFTTYFTGYNKNRENFYSKEDKSTAISFRLIDQNLPTFIKNIKYFEKIKEAIPEIKDKIERNLSLNTDELFSVVEKYKDILTQDQIENYNLAISGKSEEGNKKIQGINELVNLHNQNQQEDKSKKLPKLKLLYKQILSDTNTASFKIDKIEDDEQLIKEIQDYHIKINDLLFSNENEGPVFAFKNIRNFELSKIYINAESLTNISKKIYNDWSYLNSLREREYNENYTGKNKNIDSEKYIAERGKCLKKDKVLSVEYLESLVLRYDKENKEKLIKYFEEHLTSDMVCETGPNGSVIKSIKSGIEEAYKKFDEIQNEDYGEGLKNLVKDGAKKNIIKNFLDNLKELHDFVKLLVPKVEEIETDNNFYELLRYDDLKEIVPLYNKVRNYLTQKPYSTEKMKLNFKNPTLLDGWDLNKEKDNSCTIFERNGIYYLGIIDSRDRGIFSEIGEELDQKNSYKKMEYKLLPGANKMLPKVFISSEKGRENFNPSVELLEKYQDGCHKKGEKFDIDFCHELIDFFKRSIEKHDDWKKFNFRFSETSSYEDISQFYKEVEQQGYKINFKNISAGYIDQLVNDGKLYLFKIYNKDFSEYSKGKPNLHTMYWKALFDEDNLKDVVYKLNGQAEIFYRKKSIEAKITHPANEPIPNKNEKNPKKESKFEYDLIKDRRYSVDKFLFHVPVAMNFKCKGFNNINEIVNDSLKANKDIYLIGIDRGERHLIYLSVINSEGEIVEQCSLNNIVNEYNGVTYETDYRAALNKKEKDRDEARKSWDQIETIKELKEGYMSQVVHKIVKLMLKYNAIIVLEDLSGGFKNSRKKVEKQVYDKFETMLVNKLSYLISKDVANKKDQGGVLNAYQLAKPDSKGAQNGVIFYIPAWCTSKIDPTTGFVNLFDLKKVDKSFIEKFDDIRYNEEENYFEFIFKYSNFTGGSYGIRDEWILCSYGERVRSFRNPEKNSNWDNEEINLTDEFKELFKRYEIDLSRIKEGILQNEKAKFFSATKEKDGYLGFYSLFKLLLQLRNSITNSREDYILSPVKNKSGEFYDSRKQDKNLPLDADANGAYNIARKGLMILERIRESTGKKVNFAINKQEWLSYVQGLDKA